MSKQVPNPFPEKPRIPNDTSKYVGTPLLSSKPGLGGTSVDRPNVTTSGDPYQADPDSVVIPRPDPANTVSRPRSDGSYSPDERDNGFPVAPEFRATLVGPDHQVRAHRNVRRLTPVIKRAVKQPGERLSPLGPVADLDKAV